MTRSYPCFPVLLLVDTSYMSGRRLLVRFPAPMHAFDKLGATVDENVFVPDGRHAVSAGGDRNGLAMVFIMTDGGIVAFESEKNGCSMLVRSSFTAQVVRSSDKVAIRMPVFLEHDASCGLTRTSDALTSYIRCSFSPKRLKIQRLQTRNSPSRNRSPKMEFNSYIRCSLAPKDSYIRCSHFVHQMQFSLYSVDFKGITNP